MTHSIFNSVRKLNFYSFKTKYINQNESTGEFFKKHSIGDFGSIPEPSCLDYDVEQSLIAIGSKKGLIKIFGFPGISYSNRLENQDEIWNIKFILGTNYVVTLTSENKLIMWLISASLNELLKVDSISNLNPLSSGNPERSKQLDYNNNNDIQIQQNITAIEVVDITSSIILGNGEGSLIQVKLDLSKMRKQTEHHNANPLANGSIWQIPTITDVIHKDRILSKLPFGSQSRVELNSVIHISARPGSRKHLLIGYRSGHAVVYDLQKDTVEYLISGKVSLNGLSWKPSDPIVQDNFLISPTKIKPEYQLSNVIYSCHEDGSLLTWNLPQSNDGILAVNMGSIFPHGNNQKCLSISKLTWKKYNGGHLIIFAGGLPRSDYMTKSTITIMDVDCLQSSNDHNKLKHVVLDLTSQLIDFHTVDDIESDCIKYLLVLAEEEFFIVDLTKDEWPTLHEQQPYLNCLHHSPITAYHFLSEVQSDWIQKISEIGNQNHSHSNSVFDEWPIIGHSQKIKRDDTMLTEVWQNDLLIVGHGDGTIAFWRLGLGGCMQRIATVKSSNLFKMTDEPNLAYKDYEDDIIPFRRTGVFDPCCDDNRLAIQLIHFIGNYLLIGGYGGQVVLWGLVEKSYEKHVVEVDLTTHLSNFKWKGCQPFQHVQNKTKSRSPFQPMMALTIFPPSQITALDILEDKEHLLVACGTLHGLAMVACPKQSNKETELLTTHCTVPKNSLASQEAAMGEGWARRRTRELKKSLRSSFRRLRRRSTKRMEHPNVVNRNVSTNADNKLVKVELVENEIEFEERAIEDRPKDTANDGLIRAIKIQISVIKKRSQAGSVDRHLHLFAGAYGGMMMLFQSDNAIESISSNNPINLRLIKQYQFQHRAPILYFNMFDPDSSLLVITEEQVRLYAFPAFTLKHKLRVTAHDGFRLKNGYIVSLNDDKSTSYNNSKEPLVCALNNGGQFLLLNSINLKRKDVVQFVDKTDLMALNFTSMATSFSATNVGSVLPCGICYSGQGQVTLFEIIPKLKHSGAHSSRYIAGKSLNPS